jgi:hypothetical protein
MAFLLLLMSLAGCRRSQPFPSQVQPAEFDLYHAYILHYAETHPQDEQLLYINQTATGGTFLVGDGDQEIHQTYDECLSPKAHAAFLALHESPNSLGSSSETAWRTLPDGKVLPLTASPPDPKTPKTSISLSRVFFEANGKEAYLSTGVSKCNGACGGASMIWHAVRDGNSWKFNPTKCYALH